MTSYEQCVRLQFARTSFVRAGFSLLTALAAIIFASSASAWAQGTAKGSAKGAAKGNDVEPPNRPVDKLLRTDDGWQIAVTYYPSLRGQESPAIVLLHGRQDDRLVWDQGFAKRLQGEGYAVISVDLRKHGKSQSVEGDADGGKLRPVDYQQMVAEDLRVVKDFLMEEHQKRALNIRKMAIVAPEMSAPVAMAFTATDWLKPPFDDAPNEEERTPRGQDVRALVLISPELTIPGLPTAKFITQIRNPDWNIAFMTIYATLDKLDNGDANKLYQKLTVTSEKRPRSYLKTYPVALRGAQILDAETDVEAQMLAFFKVHLKELDDPWQDRMSPLQK